jgi:hypothetical protein
LSAGKQARCSTHLEAGNTRENNHFQGDPEPEVEGHVAALE